VRTNTEGGFITFVIFGSRLPDGRRRNTHHKMSWHKAFFCFSEPAAGHKRNWFGSGINSKLNDFLRFFFLGGHPKPAINRQLKTGHSL
jgi:hypothetical protein